MSMPTISDINPDINIVRDDALNMIMASIAMEELALAHILNAEGEKLQYILGTLEGRDPGEVTICDIMAVNNSVHKTLRDVIKQEMLLQLKLEDIVELSEAADECQLTIRGQKTWRDGNNVASTRPPAVEIRLLRDGEVYRTATVDSMGDGAYTFSCLPVWRDSDNKYAYRVDETVVPAGYTSAVSGFNITNTVMQGSITITGTKTWVDNDNIRGERPAQITVNLLQNGVQFRQLTVTIPTTGNTAEFSFDGVPQFNEEGVPFVYTVGEEAVTGYVTSVTGNNITNTFNQIYTTISGTKIWDDNDNAGNTRPADIRVILLQNGVEFAEIRVAGATAPDNTVPFSFTNVPMYDAQGAAFVYTVDEEAVTGYGKDIADFNITNTFL